jgi:hypothetical protein
MRRQAAAPNPYYLIPRRLGDFAKGQDKTASGGRVMIGQTFTLMGRPKLVFRVVWRGSIDCVRGVILSGKFQTLKRVADVVFVEAANVSSTVCVCVRSRGGAERAEVGRSAEPGT